MRGHGCSAANMFCLLPTSSRLSRSLCGSPQLEEAARFEAERGEELRKLQRDRRVLEKQSRAILKMPTKQSKEEVAAVEVRGECLLDGAELCGRPLAGMEPLSMLEEQGLVSLRALIRHA